MSPESVFSTYAFYLFGGVAALFVAGSYYLAYLRRKALAELAASIGLPFSAAGPPPEALAQLGLGVFAAGRSRRAKNLLEVRGSGSSPDIRFFDYRYVTGGGKSSTTHTYTAALAEFRRAAIPAFELKPETFLHKIGEIIGFKDIDIESSPVFSSEYRLTGANEQEVLAFFSPAAVICFERRPGWQAQGYGRCLVLLKKGSVPAAAYREFMAETKEIFSELVRR